MQLSNVWRRFTPAAALVAGLVLIVGFRATKPAWGEAAPEVVSVPIPSQLTAAAFTDIRHLSRQLSEFPEDQLLVVVFTTLDCPVVKRSLPRLRELEAEFGPRGVQFLAVNVGPQDDLMDVAAQAVRADLPFPIGKDFDGSFARAMGASRVPEVVVLDRSRTIRYRGRIDNQVRLTGVAPRATREDLREALEDLLAGRAVAVPSTPVEGCLIELDRLIALPAAVPDTVTYSEHIAPLLAKHCVDCHRPGAVGPFALTDYDGAASHAQMIAEVVQQRRMPPVYCGDEFTEIANRRALSREERALVMAWARQGQPRGESIAAAPVEPVPTWQIGEPDLVIRPLLASHIPASGIVPYQYAILPHVFQHDTWVQGVEILPGNSEVVHHCNLAYVTATAPNDFRNFITGYVPGGDPMDLKDGIGFLIPKGSLLALQLHYVTTGAAATDRTAVGLRFARETIQKRLQHFQGVAHRFAIPPGAPHYPLSVTRTLKHDATGVGMFSHMHLRGKDMLFRAIYPDGREEDLLLIANYNFNWQLSYQWAPGEKKFPAGTKFEVTAHFDNSAFNPYNPDPTATVREGQQTYDEMMYGFLFYTDDNEELNLTIDPRNGRVMGER